MKPLLLTLLASIALPLLLACGGGEDSPLVNLTPSDQTPRPTTQPRVAPTNIPGSPVAGAACVATPGSKLASVQRTGQRTFAAAPERVIDPAKTYVATITTSKGTIVGNLAAKDAPNTVNNFVFLACSGYYDGLTFHRYEAGFVIQGGDPLGNGSGGPGYGFATEISPNLNHDKAGIFSMARSNDPNSNGSQFFITLGAASHLNGGYSVFGEVTQGMDVVNQIRAGDRITSISITES